MSKINETLAVTIPGLLNVIIIVQVELAIMDGLILWVGRGGIALADGPGAVGTIVWCVGLWVCLKRV